MFLLNDFVNIMPDSSQSLISDTGNGAKFEKALYEANAKNKKIVSDILNKKSFKKKLKQDAAYSFKMGHQKPSEVLKSLDISKSALPASYKNKIGLGLIALGREGSSLNSMGSGAALMNSGSPFSALKNIFKDLGAEANFLSLDKNALPTLAQILADSGVDNESINDFIEDALKSGLTVDSLLYSFSKINPSEENNSSAALTATEDAMPAFGQFFASLGASSEIVDMISSAFKNGDEITAQDLRNILASSDDGFLAPALSEADAYNLASLLRSMGASQRNLNSLANLLSETEGRLSMNGFLDFIQSMEQAPSKSISSDALTQIKELLENIGKEQELAKTPVFDEILTKIQMLGDRELDGNFLKLSPALQALRGGLSQMQNAAFGGQMGQNNGSSSQGGHDDKEQRHLMNASVNGNESSQAAAIETVATAQSFGGQESLARYISQKMIYSQRRGINRLRMKLNPESMGRLDIDLKVKGDQILAHIKAESLEAYQALTAEINSLKEALAEGGLEISHITIAFDDQSNGTMEFADLGDFNSAAKKKMEQGEVERIFSPAGELHRVV